MIVVAGVCMNFILGWAITSAVLMVGVPQAVIVTGIAKDSPAEAAGIRSGDAILGFEQSHDFISFVNEHRGESVTIRVMRAHEEISLAIVPRLNPPEGEGALGIILGDVGKPRAPFWESITDGFTESLGVLGMIFSSLGKLVLEIFSGGGVTEGFVGPVGIFKVASETGQFGLVYLLELIGLISLNLVVLNVLPIPALDGGRLLFLLIEKIKGSPLPARREMIANAIGFGVLILLMVAITIRDVVKIF